MTELAGSSESGKEPTSSAERRESPLLPRGLLVSDIFRALHTLYPRIAPEGSSGSASIVDHHGQRKFRLWFARLSVYVKSIFPSLGPETAKPLPTNPHQFTHVQVSLNKNEIMELSCRLAERGEGLN